jgi:Fic family protein
MLYDSPTAMEPMLPSDPEGQLESLAVRLIRASAELGGRLHPTTRTPVVELLRKMNSYYSNLIEGHNTHPVMIERALHADYSTEPAKRALQVESAAHVEVQKLVEGRVRAQPNTDICDREFLEWIHREFYSRMPQEFMMMTRDAGPPRHIEPGALRSVEVSVGEHLAPKAAALHGFMARFGEVYEPSRLPEARRIVAGAAAHHRLLWIHPFLDGNGRVARLFTHAYLHKARVDGHGLWTITRGFARHRPEYLSTLASADAPRRGDLDGRGNLSDLGLRAFCEFFLKAALDQVEYMSSLLELETLGERIAGYIEQRGKELGLRREGASLLRDILLRGELPRGEIPRVTGLAERTSRVLVAKLAALEMIYSETPKSPVRLSFPPRVVGYFFPRLYPEGVEATLSDKEGQP